MAYTENPYLLEFYKVQTLFARNEQDTVADKFTYLNAVRDSIGVNTGKPLPIVPNIFLYPAFQNGDAVLFVDVYAEEFWRNYQGNSLHTIKTDPPKMIGWVSDLDFINGEWMYSIKSDKNSPVYDGRSTFKGMFPENCLSKAKGKAPKHLGVIAGAWERDFVIYSNSFDDPNHHLRVGTMPNVYYIFYQSYDSDKISFNRIEASEMAKSKKPYVFETESLKKYLGEYPLYIKTIEMDVIRYKANNRLKVIGKNAAMSLTKSQYLHTKLSMNSL